VCLRGRVDILQSDPASKGSRSQRDIYVKSILPIGVLFSGSLILSNTAYLT
jgi:hypothetical protein